MTTREIFQVQARLSGVTPEGWHSSRQAKTMYVAAIDEIDAVRMVSDLCWDMSGPMATRVTYATVAPMDGDMVMTAKWMRVTLHRSGSTETVTGDTYASVKFNPTVTREREDND